MTPPASFHLCTPRLKLEPFQPEADFRDFHRLASNPDVMRYISGGMPFSEEHSRDWLAGQVAHLGEHGYARWRLSLRETGEFVGLCGAEMKVLDGERVPELGWWIVPELWGMGLASEAAQATLSHLWDSVRLTRITACALPDNAPSIRIMQKLGLTYEKHFWEESPFNGERLWLVMHGRNR
jgi:[ribosomal protein S5]-alanine N-acetyltransferase